MILSPLILAFIQLPSFDDHPTAVLHIFDISSPDIPYVEVRHVFFSSDSIGRLCVYQDICVERGEKDTTCVLSLPDTRSTHPGNTGRLGTQLE